MVELTVLGIAQDGGQPQAGCLKSCCSMSTPSDVRYPVTLGIVDHDGSTHLIEVSCHLGKQLCFVWKLPAGSDQKNKGIDHVWITHAHLGHVNGLGLLGREAMNAEGIHLHVLESMANLIRRTPSWNLLADLGVFHIEILNRKE